MATSFQPAVKHDTGSQPSSVTTVDVNADGKLDLITADNGAGVSVLLGDGSRGFGLPVAYAPGLSPISVMAADVNGDGKPDLIIGDNGGGVSVLLNTGGGAFSAATTYDLSLIANAVAAADLNGDGKPDLVVADQGGGVSVLLNNGSGLFGTAANYAAGLSAVSVTTADVNRDGKPDLVVADFTGTVSVLLNDGAGTFGTATSYAAGADTSSVTTADLNRDGKIDLIAAVNSEDAVSVLLGDGPTVTSIASTLSRPGPLNAGQTIDFAVTTSSALQVTGAPILQLSNGGTASYTGGSGTTSLQFHYTVAANQDSSDLVVTGLALNGGTIGTGADALTFAAATPYGAGLTALSLAAADVNGDGKLDLLTANQGGVSVLLANGSGGFGAAAAYGAGLSAHSVTAADVDGDGKLDLVIADSSGVSVLSGDGAGGFGTATTYVAGSNPTSVTTADVNGDGKLDVVAADSTGLSVLLNDGTGAFNTVAAYAAGSNPSSVTTADVSGDGKLDLVVADTGGGVSVLLNDGSGVFGTAVNYAGALTAHSVTTADVNGDGKLDLIVADIGGVSVLLNNGAGGFGTATSFAAGSNPTSVTTVDVNGDGKLDLVAADSGAGLSVLLGDGVGGFGTATAFAAGADPFAVTTADVDGDGRPDLVAADSSGGIKVLANASTSLSSLDAATAAKATGADTGAVVDTTAPSATVGTLAANDIVDAAERFAGVAVSGTTSGAEAGRTVTVKLLDGQNTVVETDTTTLASVDANGNATWTVNSAALSTQPDAAYTVTANVSDQAGNAAVEATKSITVDTAFASSPAIDLAAVAFDSAGTVNLLANNLLRVTENSLTSDLQLNQTHDFSGVIFSLSSDGGSGTTITATCYCPSTLIATEHGEVAVEALAIGDRVVTMSGAARPIRWIGRRSYSRRFALGRKHILPICIQAGALDDGVPRRDLWISPHHAMYLEGVLIEARDLVNGVSVIQAAEVETIEYFHIELDSHDVIIAEGALAESFVDDDSRELFHNAHDYRALYPDSSQEPAQYCAPRLGDGYEVEAARRHIDGRAGLRTRLNGRDAQWHGSAAG